MAALSSDIFVHGNFLALPLVLAGGLLAGLNPCCVAMYPAATASCCAISDSRKHGTLANLAFVVGAASATAMLGIAAALLGRVMGQFGTTARYAIAFVPMLMAFYLLGWLKLPTRQGPVKCVGSGLGAAFVSGVLLALLISPCGTPILASVLSYAAFKGNIALGTLLLFLYGVGSAAPVILLGSAATAALRRNGRAHWQDKMNWASGAILVATSFYLIWKV